MGTAQRAVVLADSSRGRTIRRRGHTGLRHRGPVRSGLLRTWQRVCPSRRPHEDGAKRSARRGATPGDQHRKVRTRSRFSLTAYRASQPAPVPVAWRHPAAAGRWRRYRHRGPGTAWKRSGALRRTRWT